jgi:N-acylneuraminate cytidylyltransferase
LTVAVIPARGGSVRVPRKNIRDFRGKPIIEYPIAQIKRCGLFDACIVSTDDDEIAEIAERNGCSIHRRAVDDGCRGTQEVARMVLADWPEASIACVVYATSPLLDSSDLDRGYAVLQKPGALFTMSVSIAPLADAGCFYWGRREAFMTRAPLIDSHTVMVPMPGRRVCDINTEKDFARAEAMYDELHKRDKR